MEPSLAIRPSGGNALATFVIAHGAWSAGWAWKKMRPLLRRAAHEVFTPTYTGLGERRHLVDRSVDLETHIADVVGVLTFEDLRDVILVGHSYGGVVATGVADRLRDRVAHLVYVDAFVPIDGQCLFDLLPESMRADLRDRAASQGDGWLVPPNALPPDTPDADVAWIGSRRLPQPIATFTCPLRLAHQQASLPRSYIYCTRAAPGDIFRPFARAAQAAPRWQYFELDASHNPHITAAPALAAILAAIAATSATNA